MPLGALFTTTVAYESKSGSCSDAIVQPASLFRLHQCVYHTTMSLWKWRTLPDGRVEVNRQDGNGFQAAPSLDHHGVVTTADKVSQWEELASKYAAKYNIPQSWILAFILAESGGDPSAENFCCAGLMGIYWSVHKKTKADMLDPEKNIDYGASLLASTAAKGYQLPGVASVHVAGGGHSGTPHDSIASPWGMREHMWLGKPGVDGSVGYIDRVVRANNYWIDRLGGVQPASAGKASLSSIIPFAVGAAGGFAALVTILPRLKRL